MKDKTPLENDKWKKNPQKKKKNTKKWCKGKVGVEHIPVVELEKSMASLSQHSNNPPCYIPTDKSSGLFGPLNNKEEFIQFLCCSHHVVCEVCGKELSTNVDVCPTTGLDFTKNKK